ncbi:MAG: PLP-dependent aminotransferase family protein [Deltaproteobacteria bacterium]|nr:PLP-dependent aminotransferase family protein [Deltaproteobacteria bacterium]
MSLLIAIDKKSKTPIFRQIIDRIIERIDSDAVKPGASLPSTRSMADSLAVNRSTVYRAYQELWSLGYLESRPGAYTTVRKRVHVASERTDRGSGLIAWSEKIASGGEVIHEAYSKQEALNRKSVSKDVINFIPLSPDNRLFPAEAFRKCMNEALAREGAELLQYGSPMGYEPLKKFIAGRMREHSVSLSNDEIMITAGAQNAIELLVRSFAGPESSIIIEAPTYSKAIDILRLSSSKIIEVPMSAEGMDLDVLERIVGRTSPAMIYSIPNFHNPTGITTDQNHRERLLKICEHFRIPLVEDGFEEEMKYFGKAVLPVKSMDLRKVVIYVGTFSKILFPGLRIGWIAADKECIDRLVAIQQASIISGSLLSQSALYRFCRSGHYDAHIRRMHRVYRKRMLAVLKALKTNMQNEHIEWTEPSGGYALWVRLKELAIEEDELMDFLIDRGVAVMPGSSSFYGPPNGIYFRLSIAHLDEWAIDEGIARLGKSLNDLYEKKACAGNWMGQSHQPPHCRTGGS